MKMPEASLAGIVLLLDFSNEETNTALTPSEDSFKEFYDKLDAKLGEFGIHTKERHYILQYNGALPLLIDVADSRIDSHVMTATVAMDVVITTIKNHKWVAYNED